MQKIVVIGHVMTGKTCLMQRYTSGRYSQEKYKSTVGADFSTKDLHFGDYHVNLQVWLPCMLYLTLMECSSWLCSEILAAGVGHSRD